MPKETWRTEKTGKKLNMLLYCRTCRRFHSRRSRIGKQHRKHLITRFKVKYR